MKIVRLISSSTSLEGDLLHRFLRMGQSKRNVVPVARVHLVCCNCRSWVEFKGALYKIWCGVNRLGDSGVKVV